MDNSFLLNLDNTFRGLSAYKYKQEIPVQQIDFISPNPLSPSLPLLLLALASKDNRR
jgi:hypothetical protein